MTRRIRMIGFDALARTENRTELTTNSAALACWWWVGSCRPRIGLLQRRRSKRRSPVVIEAALDRPVRQRTAIVMSLVQSANHLRR